MCRAATDPADPNPDPDLLTTRIQKSRSGSVKKICLLNLVKAFEHLKFFLNFLTKISSIKYVLLKNCKRKRPKTVHFGVFLLTNKNFHELMDPDPDPDPDLSLSGPGSSFSDPWQL